MSAPIIAAAAAFMGMKTAFEGLKEGNVMQAVLGGFGAYMGLSGMGAFSGLGTGASSMAGAGAEGTVNAVVDNAAVASDLGSNFGTLAGDAMVQNAALDAANNLTTSIANQTGNGLVSSAMDLTSAADLGTIAGSGGTDLLASAASDMMTSAPAGGSGALDASGALGSEFMSSAPGAASTGSAVSGSFAGDAAQALQAAGSPVSQGGIINSLMSGDIAGVLKKYPQLAMVGGQLLQGYSQAKTEEERLKWAERIAAEARKRRGHRSALPSDMASHLQSRADTLVGR